MANTFSQIYVHLVFAVQNRNSLIKSDWEDSLYKYISGIVLRKGQKMIAINGMPDHIHILLGIKPDCTPSDLIREIKKSSNEFIKKNNYTKFNFSWQEGFGSFTHSHSQVDRVVKYIINQKEHHRKKSFKEEYLNFLKENDLEFEEKYLFKFDSEES